jgi:hypothetical protein
VTVNERLKDAAESLRRVYSALETVANQTAELTAEKTRLETDVLPSLFAEAGLSEITTSDGVKVKLGLVASGSLPKDPELRKLAIEWLVANGYESIIESKVVASWTRGDRAKAETLFQSLRGDNSAKTTLDDSVHAMTLAKIAKDRVQSGQEVPLTTLGVSVMSRARITNRGAV